MLHTYEEAADILGLSPKYVRKLCSTRKLGYVVKRWMVKAPDGRFYLRRKRLIPTEEIIRYLFVRRSSLFMPVLREGLRRSEAKLIEAKRLLEASEREPSRKAQE